MEGRARPELSQAAWVIRGGVNTLTVEALWDDCNDAFATLGLWGFSTYVGECEKPEELGVYVANARMRHTTVERVTGAGFRLVQTRNDPHHTFVVADEMPSEADLRRAAAVFTTQPIQNPQPRRARR